MESFHLVSVQIHSTSRQKNTPLYIKSEFADLCMKYIQIIRLSIFDARDTVRSVFWLTVDGGKAPRNIKVHQQTAGRETASQCKHAGLDNNGGLALGH